MVNLYPYKYVFVKDGSTYRCDRSNLDGTTTALSSNSDMLTVWNAAKTDAGLEGAHFHFRNSTYDIASPGATISAGGRYVVTGETIYGTVLKATGNYPVLKVLDTTGVSINNIRFLTEVGATYSANALELATNGTSRSWYELNMLSIEHSISSVRQQYGSGLGINLTGANSAISWVNASYINVAGFLNAIYVDSSTATGVPWTNENSFHRFNAIHSFNFCKTNQSTSHVSDGWEFNHCGWQTTAVDGTTGHMFDVDDSGTHRHWSLDHCFAWDYANTNHKLVKVNANTQMGISNCIPTYSTYLGTGSGWKNGALIQCWDHTSERTGQVTFSASGTTTDFAFAPTTYFLDMTDCDIIITPASLDAMGPFAIKSVSSSTVTVTYKKPPRAGTNNVILNYYARRKTMGT